MPILRDVGPRERRAGDRSRRPDGAHGRARPSPAAASASTQAWPAPRATVDPAVAVGGVGRHDRPREAQPRRLGQPPWAWAPGAARRPGRPRRTTTRSAGSGRSRRALTTARHTARSAPGSVSRTPPTAEANTSCWARRSPARRSSTASSSASRPPSRPCALRRGGTPGVTGLVSACTSTSSGRWPSSVGVTAEPADTRCGGRRGTAGWRRARRSSPCTGHLEHAELAGGAEAVLDRAQQPQRVVAVALEASTVSTTCSSTRGPARPPSLVTWPTSTHGQAAPLGLGDQAVGAAADLHRRCPAPSRAPGRRWSGCCRSRPASGCSSSIAATIVRQRRLGQQPQVGPQRVRAARRGARTCWALSSALTYSVGAAPAARRSCSEQRALADARLAAEQRDRAGDQPAAEHPVELADAAWGGAAVPVDVAWAARRRRGGRRRRARGAGPGPSTSSTSVFHAAQPVHRPPHFGWAAPHSVQR